MATQRDDLIFGIGFETNTAGLDKAKASLQEIKNLTANNFSLKGDNSNLESVLKEAKTSAEALDKALTSAYNQKIGTINVEKFNQELKNSGTSLEQVYTKMNALGSKGENAFRNIATQAMTTELKLKQATSVTDKLFNSLKRIAQYQIGTSLVNNIIGGLGDAVSYIKKLDESLNSIQIVTGYSADKMADFAVQANEAAKALGQTTTAYTDAALIFAQQGLGSSDIEERTEITLKMMNVLDESASTASENLTAILNNFDEVGVSAEEYIDKITALGATTAASSDEVATALSKYASVADTIGLSYDYATSMADTLIASTRQGADTVGTALKTILARLQQLKLGETLDDGVSLGTYSQALNQVGVEILDTNGELKDADTILQSLASRWNDLSNAQKVALSETVAGTRQYTYLTSLMDNWDLMEQNLQTASDAEGTLAEQNERYMDSVEAKANTLKSTFQDLYSSILNSDVLKGGMSMLTFFVQGFATLIKGVSSGIPVFTAFAAVLMAVFSGKIAGAVTSLTQNFSRLKQNADAVQQKINFAEQIKQLTEMKNATDGTVKSSQELLNLYAELESSAGTAFQNGIINENQFESIQQYIRSAENAVQVQRELTKQIEAGQNAASAVSFGDKSKASLGKIGSDLGNKSTWDDLKKNSNTAAGLEEIQKVINKVKEAEKEYEKLGNTIKKTMDSKYLSDNFIEKTFGDTESMDLTEEKIVSLSEAVEEMISVCAEDSEEAQALKSANDALLESWCDLLVAEKDLNLTDEERNGVIQRVCANISNLNEVLQNEGMELQGNYGKTRLALENITKLGTAEEEMKQKTEGLNNALSTVNKSMSLQNIGTQLGSAAGFLTSLNSISTAVKELKEGNESGTQLLSSLVMGVSGAAAGLGMLKENISTVSTTFKKGIDVTGEAVAVTGTFDKATRAASTAILGFQAEEVATVATTELLSTALTAIAPLLIVGAIAGAVIAYKTFTSSTKTATEELQTFREAADDAQSEVDSLQSELEQTQSRIEELNAQETLSITDEEELKQLKLENNELERKIKLKEKEAEQKKKEAADKAYGYDVSETAHENANKVEKDATSRGLASENYGVTGKPVSDEAYLKALRQDISDSQDIVDDILSSGDYDETDEKVQEWISEITEMYKEDSESVADMVSDVDEQFELTQEQVQAVGNLNGQITEDTSAEDVERYFNTISGGADIYEALANEADMMHVKIGYLAEQFISGAQDTDKFNDSLTTTESLLRNINNGENADEATSDALNSLLRGQSIDTSSLSAEVKNQLTEALGNSELWQEAIANFDSYGVESAKEFSSQFQTALLESGLISDEVLEQLSSQLNLSVKELEKGLKNGSISMDSASTKYTSTTGGGGTTVKHTYTAKQYDTLTSDENDITYTDSDVESTLSSVNANRQKSEQISVDDVNSYAESLYKESSAYKENNKELKKNQKELEEATDELTKYKASGEDNEKTLNKLTKAQQDAQKAVNKSNKKLDEGSESYKKLAADSMETAAGIDQLKDVWDDAYESITGGDSFAKASGINDLKEAMGEILNVDSSNLSDSFIEQNLSDIEKLTEGGKEAEAALEDLRNAAAEDYLNNALDIDDSGKLAEAQTSLRGLKSELDNLSMEDYDFVATADLDDSQYTATLNKMLEDGDITKDQINEYLGEAGYEGEFYTKEIPMDPVTTTYTVTSNAKTTVPGGLGEPVTTGTTATYSVTESGKKIQVPQIKGINKKSTSASGTKHTSGSSGSSGSGSKGSGSGSKSSIKNNKQKYAEKDDSKIDAFHDIDRELEELNGNLEKTQSLEDILTGADAQNNLKTQISLLKQINKANKEKISIAQKEIATEKAKQKAKNTSTSYFNKDTGYTKSAITYRTAKKDGSTKKASSAKGYWNYALYNKIEDDDYGATFDSDGNITNYSDRWNYYNNQIKKIEAERDAFIKWVNSKSKKWRDKNSDKISAMTSGFEESLSNAKDNLSGFEDWVSEYEDLQDKIVEAQQEILDNALTIIENQIKEFNITVTATMDLKEFRDSWTDFKNNTWKKMNKLSIRWDESVANADTAKELLTNATKALPETLKSLQSKKSDYAEAEALKSYISNGYILSSAPNIANIAKDNAYITSMWDSTTNSYKYIYDETDALEDVKSGVESAMSVISDIMAAKDDLFSSLIDEIGTLNENGQKIIDAYNNVVDTLSTNGDILKILFGESDSGLNSALYKTQAEARMNILSAQKKLLDSNRKVTEDTMYEMYRQAYNKATSSSLDDAKTAYDEFMKMTEDAQNKALTSIDSAYIEAYETASENVQDITSDILSTIEDGLQGIVDYYTTVMEAFFKEYESEILDLVGKSKDSWEGVAEEWESITAYTDTYLDDINAASGIQQIMLQYESAIAKTTNKAAKQKLATAKAELNLSRERGKLTQYDLDRAQAKYDLLLKEIALEEAQSNKNTMRLQRDAYGNYSYVFTADQDALLQAQQEVETAKNDLYNSDKDQYTTTLENMQSAYDSYKSSVNDLYSELLSGDIDQDEYNVRLDNLSDNFSKIMEQYMGDYDDAYNNLSESMSAMGYSINDIDSLIPESLSEVKAFFIDGQASVSSLVDNVMKESEDVISQYIQDTKDWLISSYGDQEVQLASLLSTASNLEDIKSVLLGGAIVNGEDIYTKLMTSSASVTELIYSDLGYITSNIRSMLDTIVSASSLWTNTDITLTSTYKLVSSLEALVCKHYTDDTGGAEEGVSTGQTTTSEGGNVDASAVATKWEAGQRAFLASGATLYTDSSKIAYKTLSANDTVTLKSGTEAGLVTIETSDGKTYYVDKDILYTQLGSSEFLSSKVKYSKFASGGYTGDWADANGKLAILDSKELVLNAEDTENILSSVNILRNLISNLNSNSLDSFTNIKTLLTKNSSVNNSLSNENISETGHNNIAINAEFNCGNLSDIEEGFKNIGNYTSQYLARTDG